jgi:hypothetical protein
METALGLVGLVLFVIGMLVLSAAVTALVVRLSPTSKASEPSS